MNVDQTLRVGDEVQVPWGLDSVRGLVLDIYGPPGGRHALVELDFGGQDREPQTVSLRLEELTRSSAA